MAFDIDELPALANKVMGLVRLATDKSAGIDERRNAALAACTTLKDSGALAEVEKLTSHRAFKSLKKLLALRALVGDD